MSDERRIMNIPCALPDLAGVDAAMAYKLGHRDARHAAAEIACGADTVLAEMGGVRVKPLEWEDYPVKDAPILTRAVTPNGTYFICDDTDDFTGLYCEFVSYKDATWYGTVRPSTTVICDHQHVDDPTTLKAAAQADYEARILAAIQPAPVSVREAALIEATDYARNRLERIASASWNGDGRDLKRSIQGIFVEYDEALRSIAEGKPNE